MNSPTEFYALGELGKITSGSTPDTNNPNYWGGEIPWITPSDLTGFEDVFFTGQLRKISAEGYKSCSTQMLPAGTILYSSRAPIGHCAIAAFPLCTNQGFKSLIPNKKLDSVYGYYALKYFTPQIISLGRGATFGEVSKELFEAVEIPTPPLPEQQRIAAILLQADRIRKLRRYSLQLSQSFLQSVFLQMFGDPNRNPKAWDKSTFEDVITLAQTGFASGERSNFGSIQLRMNNIDLSGNMDLSDSLRVPASLKQMENYALCNNDILFNETNSPELVGKSAVFRGYKEPVLFSNHFLRLKVDEKKAKPDYLNMWLIIQRQKGLFERICTRWVNQATVRKDDLLSFPFPNPPLSIQKSYCEIVQNVNQGIKFSRESFRQSELLFQSLLQRAFTGQL